MLDITNSKRKKRRDSIRLIKLNLQPEQLFMISVLVVNAGNYIYNLLLGRFLGPEKFADAAVLVTFLLVLSFLAMTFQLVTAKFSVQLDLDDFLAFKVQMYRYALFISLILGLLIIFLSKSLQNFFNTSSSNMFVIFGFGVPIYFLLSVNRGIYQGQNQLKLLSITYQGEMFSRLIITIGLLLIFNFNAPEIIAIGILISFVVGLMPFDLKNVVNKNVVLERKYVKKVKQFFVITAFYELTQIAINNSDILLVKHYFDSYEAGLYASLALIGRVVYFMAWMFVMLLLPKVVLRKKEGKETSSILFKYVAYIGILTSSIIIGCVLFPDSIILLLFGEEYVSMSSLLWKYALATGLFAISNIFAYYYLSLDRFIPVIISGICGVLQIVLIIFFHNSIDQIVNVQIYAMMILLGVQLLFFLNDWRLNKTR